MLLQVLHAALGLFSGLPVCEVPFLLRHALFNGSRCVVVVVGGALAVVVVW